MTTHTPTPWSRKGNKVQAGAHQVEAIGISMAGKPESPRMVTAYDVNFYVRKEEDAAFIVRAVNSFEALQKSHAKLVRLLLKAKMARVNDPMQYIDLMDQAILAAEQLEVK